MILSRLITIYIIIVFTNATLQKRYRYAPLKVCQGIPSNQKRFRTPAFSVLLLPCILSIADRFLKWKNNDFQRITAVNKCKFAKFAISPSKTRIFCRGVRKIKFFQKNLKKPLFCYAFVVIGLLQYSHSQDNKTKTKQKQNKKEKSK